MSIGMKFICPEGWSQETWRQAMLNANEASDNFVPNYIRNNADVRKVLATIKNYKEEAKPCGG